MVLLRSLALPSGAWAQGSAAPQSSLLNNCPDSRIEEVVVPLPNDFSGQARKLVRFKLRRKHVRSAVKNPIHERPRIALCLGQCVADWLIEVQAEDALHKEKNWPAPILALAKGDRGRKFNTHTPRRSFDAADTRNWQCRTGTGSHSKTSVINRQ